MGFAKIKFNNTTFCANARNFVIIMLGTNDSKQRNWEE